MIRIAFDASSVYEVIFTMSNGVALWASARRAHAHADPVADLTRRVRQPVRWTLTHPVRALWRAAGGR
jgi:hypothetical protein